MPRCLVIDWDQDRCHVLAGNVTRAGVRIERALVWAQEETFDAAQGEEVGKKFKEFLKSSGLAAAPLLICLPKQGALFKDLRIPGVPVDEEPALVRFQASKELLENPDDIVLDYATMSRSASESQVLVTAVRKDLLAGYAALAKGAGLKLLAVTPRPFVLGDLLARSREIDPIPSAAPPEWSAVLLLGKTWAELTILSKGAVRFARSMANDETVESEVRRSLVMFATQAQGQTVKILYLFGQGATLQFQERLEKALQIPVTRPRVLSEDDAPAGGAECAAATGLLQAWGKEKLAVNFVKPKEPKPPAPSNNRLWVLIGGAAFVALAFLWVLGQQSLTRTQNLILQARSDKATVEKQLKSFDQDRVDLDAFDDWEQGTISWVDEIYDISTRFPMQPGFHLTKIDGSVANRRNLKEKEKFQAHVTLVGKDPNPLLSPRGGFQDSLHDDYRQVRPGPSTKDSFTIQVDLSRQLSDKFVSQVSK